MAEKTLIVKVDLSCHRCNKKIRKVLDKYKGRWNIEKISYDEKNGAVKLTGPFDIELLKKNLCCKACKIIKDFIIPEPPKPPPEKVKPSEPSKPPPEKVKPSEPSKPPPEKVEPSEPPKSPPEKVKPSEPPCAFPFPYPYPLPIWYPSGCNCGPCPESHNPCSCGSNTKIVPSGCGCGCGSTSGCSGLYEPANYGRPACRLVYEEEGATCDIM